MQPVQLSLKSIQHAGIPVNLRLCFYNSGRMVANILI